jgi:outer membrane protein, multidrug efflux system
VKNLDSGFAPLTTETRIISQPFGALGRVALLAVPLLVGGCAIKQEATQPAERAERANADMAALFPASVELDRPLTLYSAQAYALKYNVDRRARMMEEAAAMRLNSVAAFGMLPQMAASAGYTFRSNNNESFGYTPSSDSVSAPSISSDRMRSIANLGMAWNVLDFGVGYLRARQQSNLVLVAGERRRKAVQTIMNDVRGAYWRALNAQNLRPEVDALEARVLQAWQAVEADRARPTVNEAQFKRQLVDMMQQIQLLRREIESARADLASLMNVSFRRNIVLASPVGFDQRVPLQRIDDVEALERLALAERPELREEDYSKRINRDETRKAMLRMLPGFEISASLNRDTNRYLVNHDWADAGLRLTWNLLNLISGPANISAAEAQEQVGELRRLSVSMAVIAQVNVSARRYQLARVDYDLAVRVAELENAMAADAGAGKTGLPRELEILQRGFGRLFASFRRDAAFIEVQNAAGAMTISIGKDPLPGDTRIADVDTLALELERRTGEWTIVQPAMFAQAPTPSPQLALTPTTLQLQPANPSEPGTFLRTLVVPMRGAALASSE